MSQVKGALARYNSDPDSIPDAIYDNTGGGWADIAGTAVEGGRNLNKSLPQTPGDATSALDHFKHIVGERHKVLRDSSGNNFVLLNYAYANTPSVSIEYSIEGVTVAANGALDFSDAHKAGDTAVFTPPSTGFYYASYSWQNSAGAPVQSVTDEPVAYNAATMYVFKTSLVVAGSLSLKYFQSVTPLPAPISVNDPSLGRLAVGNTVVPSQEITVDYDVADWRQIVHDSAPSSSVVRVPLNTVESAQSVYSLVTTAPDMAFNTTVLPATNWAAPASTAWINYRTGDIDYSQVAPSVVLPNAARARLSYRTTSNWAIQPSVAASSYYAYASSRTIFERWREFYWNPGDQIMYFHASEAGKTIMVSFTVGGSKVTNQIMTIGAKLIPAPLAISASGFATAGSKIAAVNFIDSTGATPVAADALTSVRGVSVRARAAWIQSGQYTQEVAEMYRPLN